MATSWTKGWPVYLFRVGLSAFLLLLIADISIQDDKPWLSKNGVNSDRIQLRNLGSRHHRRTVDINKADGYVTDNRQENVSPKMLGGIVIQHESQKLSARLRWLSNDEIGITTMQAIYDSLPYSNEETNLKSKLDKITNRLQTRLRSYLQVLRTNKITVENLYKFHVKQPITRKLDCCSIEFKEFKSENQYGCRISRQTSCDLIPPSTSRGSFNPGRNLTEVWRSNVQYFSTLKWQYFISVEGIHSEYPANGFLWSQDCHNVHDTRHRDVFLSTIQPQRKQVVIMMDHGNSMSKNQLHTAKAIAKHLLASFSKNDRVGIIGLSSKPTHPRSDACLTNSLVPATFETRAFFNKFVNGLNKVDSTTNHSLGFETAFKMIQNSLRESHFTEHAMILYISRGLLSSLTEAGEVMDIISVQNARTGNNVIINTYAVIDDGKPIMYEKTFLQNVAYQNYPVYNVNYTLRIPVIRGMMMAINSTTDLSSSVGRFYLPLNNTSDESPVFSLPYIDEADRSLTLTISQPCFHKFKNKNKLIGMVGVDLHVEDIVQDITYYNQDGQSYAFIVTVDGYTIMHPSFSRPIRTNIQPMHTDIRHFENVEGFELIRRGIITQEEGESTLLLESNNSSIHSEHTSKSHFYAKYMWRKVDNTPYVVVIKVLQEVKETREIKNIVSNQADLIYHRLDLLPRDKMCLNLKQLSTLDTSTIFLSANSFEDPFEHLSEDETKRIVQIYLTYLKDDTMMISNPGLKDKVRNDVAASTRINDEWMRRYKTSSLKDYIIRRYVATPSGVTRMYPGTQLGKSFDPTKRSWFSRALEFPGHVTLTAPYLDVGGAGYIVTISHTIFEGKPAALHSPADRVAAVMGMDITMGYFHKLLIESIPYCEQPTVRCFLMDDKGYLIAHPAFIDPNGKGPVVEQQHITHKEPLVANDILNHRGFVQKKLCNRYNDRTVQRYYRFNTSLEGVLTNLVHGEHCARYQITYIPGTNAFLGIVNHTCETATAFCPCSMVDRLCLNCHRMEQSECECPCECPLEMNLCTGELLDEEDSNESCERIPEEEHVVIVNASITSKLKQCYQSKCEDRKTETDCMGVIDCEWCQVQLDGKTVINKPYCASQRVCFGGVVSAHTPYGDKVAVNVMAQQFDPPTVKSTPVGPVAGGIMGCFLILALGVYCYRHHVHRNTHQYISSLPDANNRMSHYYNEPDDLEPTEEPGSGHTNFVLASFENPASISPYRVNTSYRRPAGGDSDHGYSTMTPHEDSEHASLPCLEPLLIGRDRYKPSIHGITKAPILPPPPSISRRSRSPTPPQTRLSSAYTTIPEQTCLPSSSVGPTTTILESPHNVMANVQVHMVDSR